MDRKGKEFVFPKNVNKNYGVFKDLTLKDILTIMLPTVGVFALLIILVKPEKIRSIVDILPLFIVIMCLCIALTCEFAVITVKPIKERPNITFRHYYSLKTKYNRMQKLYFLKPKERRHSIDSQT